MTKRSSLDHCIQADSRVARTPLMVCAGFAMLTTCLVGGVQADELLPIHSRAIALGPVSGGAYYTSDAAESRLVATLNGEKGGAPVRVVATLAAGQSVTLSVPAGVGEPAIEVTFSRRDGRVFVDDGGTHLENSK